MTRSGFKHCRGPGGSQIGLGSGRSAYVSVHVCVHLGMCICVYTLMCAVVKNLWSCNVIRGWVERNSSPRVFRVVKLMPALCSFQHPFSPFLPVCVCGVCSYLGSSLQQGLIIICPLVSVYGNSQINLNVFTIHDEEKL